MSPQSPQESIEILLGELSKMLAEPGDGTKFESSLFFKEPKVDADYPLAKMIDHTLLKPEATPTEIRKLCEEAKAYGFATVCVNSSYVAFAKELLQQSNVKVCSVVGFPLGAMSTEAKAFEAKTAVSDGAHEIDMVIHLGALKSRDYASVLADIQAVVQASSPAQVKVILETGALTYEEKILGALLSKLAGAHFVKTSTGFGKGGAKTEDVTLLRSIVGMDMGVKASGGIRSREDAEKMLMAGANRLGTSMSVAILKEPSSEELSPAPSKILEPGTY